MESINERSHSRTVLTGDRPTGPLHLGHYVGSLKKRVELQDAGHRCFLMIADTQAYTDNAADCAKISNAIPEVMADYIGAGVDPQKTTVFLQSAVPELAELSMLFLNLVTVSRLERNPTVREEIRLRNFERDIPAGFFAYPIAQAADILGFKANDVPVGDDQLPMVELAQETARKVNRIVGADLLPEPKAVLTRVSRLPGIDGRAKASKSLGNAIFLSDSKDELHRKVMSMFTDPGHLRIEDPGRVEGNAVFAYLDAFDPDLAEVEALKVRYRKGGLGDVTLKRRLCTVLDPLAERLREKREEAMSGQIGFKDMLAEGSRLARQEVCRTLSGIREGMGMYTL